MKQLKQYYKTIILLLFLVYSSHIKAQIEIKTNPISILFGYYPIAGELFINENNGIEASVGFLYQNENTFNIGPVKWTGISSTLSYKYYFNPKKGNDGIYVFPYLRYVNRTFESNIFDSNIKTNNEILGGGFGVGNKWVSKSNLFFELNAGIGRNFHQTFKEINEDGVETQYTTIPINFILTTGIGYRFM